ncbi:MAG: GSU2403 family nucleotidyltransferase fold protein [candidate division Zixibacteria bacterium]|nr:GSU2403 family nucleotidyltransferase fold protein [candidate division Zixibacteria bacterium]
MEKKQYELCLEILRRFHKANILNDFVLIGSWCVFFYKDYFSSVSYINHATLKTRDMDFLISKPDKIKQTIDIPNLLKDLGFVTAFRGTCGYIKLDHPDLIVEFFVPAKGKGSERPYSVPKLGINAEALRFLDFLSENTIEVKIEDFYLNLPHPVNFALHKLIVFQRRNQEDKAIKDRNIALEILWALINKGEANIIHNIFRSTPQNWQRKIIKGLQEAKEKEVLEILRIESQK